MRRMLSAVLAVGVLLAVLSGCGAAVSNSVSAVVTQPPEELDAAGVYEKMSEAVDGRCATGFDGTTRIGAKLTAGALTMEAEASAVTKVRLREEPFKFCSEADFSVNLFGAELAEAIQVYSQEGVSYLHINGSDKWLRRKLSTEPAALLGQYGVTRCDGNWKHENLALASRDENGYVLTCTYSAEDVLRAIASPFGEVSLEKVDLTAVRLAVTYHVDGATFLPSQIEIEYRGLGEVVSDVFNRYADKLPGAFGKGMRAEVNSYREVLTNLRYDAVEVPEVPAEGIEKSTEPENFNILELIGLGKA